MQIVKVTAEDIKNGRPGKCALCPIALALKRTLGTDEVSVYSEGLMVGVQYFRATQKIKDFIDRFDEGSHVRPTKFRLILD